MKIFDWFKSQFAKTPPPPRRVAVRVPKRRGFDAAQGGDLFSDWSTSNVSVNENLKRDLKRMRARARGLESNNGYMKKFLNMVQNNIAGPNGIALQMKIEDRPGELDTAANGFIETAWRKWSKIQNATVTRDQSFVEFQRFILKCLARDGEVIIRKVKGFQNDFRFALQMIDPVQLDEQFEGFTRSGNRVRLGVELDSWSAPVAYHIYEGNPHDPADRARLGRPKRIPANQIIHIFIKTCPGQLRGIPWADATMIRLQMVGGYEEAELVGARAAASKMGFFEREPGTEYKGDDVDEDGNLISEFAPGTMEELPPGVKFTSFDPGNPSSNFSDFMKAMLRGAASGLNVAYNSLSSDLEGVNFSSIRSGVLEERDCWKALQVFFIDHFMDPVFPDWLDTALVTQEIPLPFNKFDKFNSPSWQARGWPWVDPLKDAQANELEYKNRTKSLTMIAAEQGRDLENVFRQIKAERDLAKQMGVDLPELETAVANPTAPSKEGDSNETENE